ncbi:type III effector [Pantoea stewartii]|uniref:type III effector n=1 Tax=Pantoea stewartii TaxID=66269 RepID=UPI00345C0A64
MLDKIGSNTRADNALHVEAPAGPEPMRLDAAGGQKPKAPMDAPSSLRLRAIAGGINSEEAGITEPADVNQPLTTDAHPETGVNPVRLFVKLMVGTLALSTGVRFARYPGDFVKDPGGSVWAAINMKHRSSITHLEQGNQTVLERFGAHIPKDSACFNARADVTHDIPSGVAGRWNRQTQRLILNPNIHFDSHPATVAGHEFIHCYTHPEFVERHIKHPHWKALNEGLTTHLTEKLPAPKRLLPIPVAKDRYHGFKLSTGDSWTDAARRIEVEVGEDVLLKAFFGGDDQAISEVAKAAAQIYPKIASSTTERELYRAGSMRGGQHLAECYVGALLKNGQKLPDSFTNYLLPVFSYSEISPGHAEKIQAQAEKSQKRMGIVFDAAFFSPDLKTQRLALGMLREDLLMHWEKVIPDKK